MGDRQTGEETADLALHPGEYFPCSCFDAVDVGERPVAHTSSRQPNQLDRKQWIIVKFTEAISTNWKSYVKFNQ